MGWKLYENRASEDAADDRRESIRAILAIVGMVVMLALSMIR